MFRKHWWMLVLMGILALAVSGCDDSDGGDADNAGTVISGRVAQTYVHADDVETVASGEVGHAHVSGAMVIADKVTGTDGLGDFAAKIGKKGKPGEIYAYSDADGYFEMTIPHDYDDYVLASIGGSYRYKEKEADEEKRKDARPMLAPKGSKNITMATTLVALNPSLKNKIGDDWDADVAHPDGAPGLIRRIAKVAEQNAMLAELGEDVPAGDESINLRLENLEAFAQDIENEGDIQTAVAKMEDIAKNSKLTRGNALAFNPTESILPAPNDIIWADTGGNVAYPPPTDDPAAQALYTAVNAMQLKGLSPNTPIAIPLENATPIREEALKNNIKLVNYGAMLGIVYAGLGLGNPMAATPDEIMASIQTTVLAAPMQTMQTIGAIVDQNKSSIFISDLKVIQEDNFIKIYPLKPLAPGGRYLVVVLKSTCYGQDPTIGGCSVFADTNGRMVGEPFYYTFLKFEQPLTGTAAELEDLRLNYAPIYNDILPLLGINKDNTLEVFTFTTAEKTLSTDDFGLLSAYLAGQGADSLQGFAEQIAASDNLPFANVKEEYAAIHNMIPPMTIVAGPNDAETTFVSVNLSSPTQEQFGVPCVVNNADQYQDAVTIYQHGLGGDKESAAGLAAQLSMPVIAMDLPHHGDRAAEGVPSGAEYLTLNLPQNRINLYQSYFDMTALLRNIKAGLFNLDGDDNVNVSGEPPVDMDDIPAKVYFVGDSMGAITGSVFATYNADMLDRITLSAGGANWAAILDRATNAEITGLVQSLGLERNTVEYFLALGLVQTVMDPADPVWQAGPVIQDKTVLRTAYMDTLVPNVANEALANAIGWREANRLTEFSGAPPNEPGWYMYGGKEDLAANWIPHGFSYHPDYYPEAAGHFDQAYVEAAGEFAARQTAAFSDIPSANALAFYPSEDTNRAILPFPNDVAWAANEGKVRLPVPDLMSDPGTAALYTAFNALGNKGFSPNTPISIPLENSTYISWDSLENNIKLVNLNALMGVLYGALELGNPLTTPPDQVQEGVMTALAGFSEADFESLQDALGQAKDMIWESDLHFIQEDRFIKIYPVEPLAAGSRYLVYILENAPSAEGESGRFVDVNGEPVKAPLLFDYLRSPEPLMEQLESLEPLRQQYQPLYTAILPVLDVEPTNTMEILTFTTADKTLSVTDFGAIMTFLGDLQAGAGKTLADLAATVSESANLPYLKNTENGPVLDIFSEFQDIYKMTAMVPANDVSPEAFTSLNVESLPEQPHQEIQVPYAIYNGHGYTGSVVIYQHAFSSSKEGGQDIADQLAAHGLSIPVLVMDLPLHGERVSQPGDPSGAGFLSANIPKNRINLYQTYFDMTVMLNNLRAGLFDIDGDGDADDVPDKIHFMGFSGGAILGSVFAAYNELALEKIVLNQPGANMVSILDRTQDPAMSALIDSLGVQKNTLPYFVALGFVQTLMDPADPVYLSDASIIDKTIAQTGYGAIMPPAVSAVIAADTIGFAETSHITDFDDPLPVQPGHYLLGGKEGLENNGIPTAFLFEFTVEEGSGVDQAYLDAARDAAWEQIATFFSD